MDSSHEDWIWQEGEVGGTSAVAGRSDGTGVRAGAFASTVALTDGHRAVNSMIGQRRSFAEIEDYINALPLPSAQLGALWLLAWTEATDPETRSQLIADTIAGLRDTGPV
jgi:hypothetical protein